MAVVGIDLGTTISTVARPIGKVVEVLPNEEGNLLTPSVVYIPDGNMSNAIVGDSALNMLHSIEKNNVVRWSKRLIGTNHKIKMRKKNGTLVEFSPTEISAAILRKLKRDAELAMNDSVEGAVITVPAWFGLKQCGEIMSAAQLADLKVLQLIPEPQAAAIDYSMDQTLDFSNKIIFVYDLGGGTFDATLISVQRVQRASSIPSISFIEIAKEGSRELGGYDWDKQLLKYCCECFDQKHNTDSRLDTSEDLELEAEQVKKLLSKLMVATFHIHTNEIQDTIDISRDKFEELCRFLLEETRTKIRQTLRKANKTWDEIDYILVVGGASQMPMVFKMVEEEVGEENHRKICRHKGVSFNVARGAAYIAGDFIKLDESLQKSFPIEEMGDSLPVIQNHLNNNENINPSHGKDEFASKGQNDLPLLSTKILPLQPSAKKNISSQNVSNSQNVTQHRLPVISKSDILKEQKPENLSKENIKSAENISTETTNEFIQLSNIVIKRRLKEQDAIGVTGIKRGLAVNAIILPAGAYTDEEYSRTFPLADPNMTEVIIVINRGSGENLPDIEENKGQVILQGLPPNRPSGCLVEITMKMDRNGTLSVKARDIETDQYCNTIIQLDPIS